MPAGQQNATLCRGRAGVCQCTCLEKDDQSRTLARFCSASWELICRPLPLECKMCKSDPAASCSLNGMCMCTLHVTTESPGSTTAQLMVSTGAIFSITRCAPSERRLGRQLPLGAALKSAVRSVQVSLCNCVHSCHALNSPQFFPVSQCSLQC